MGTGENSKPNTIRSALLVYTCSTCFQCDEFYKISHGFLQKKLQVHQLTLRFKQHVSEENVTLPSFIIITHSKQHTNNQFILLQSNVCCSHRFALMKHLSSFDITYKKSLHSIIFKNRKNLQKEKKNDRISSQKKSIINLNRSFKWQIAMVDK